MYIVIEYLTIWYNILIMYMFVHFFKCPSMVMSKYGDTLDYGTHIQY